MEFTILPGKNPPIEMLELYDRSFEFWFQNWTDVYKRLDPFYKLSPNEFFRQDYVGVIHESENPLAVHLYSIFDLRSDSIAKHDYLSENFSASFLETLRHKEVFRVMSFEAMMVDPNYRKRSSGKSLAPLLFSQGIQFIQSLDNVDAMIAPARSDVGVAQLAQSGGCEVYETRDLHGVPVSLVCGLKQSLNFNFLTNELQIIATQIFQKNKRLTGKVVNHEFDSKRFAS